MAHRSRSFTLPGRNPENNPIRIAVFGATGVGKSSIISQFLYKTFREQHIATIEELYRIQFNISDQDITLDILDTTGHSDFKGIRNFAFSVSDAFILVYSLTDSRSFDEVTKLRDEILIRRSGVPIVIVANKSDEKSTVDIIEKETCEAIVRIDWESVFVEASAKDDNNIGQIFEKIISLISLKKRKCLSAAHIRRFSSSDSKTVHSNKKGKLRNGCQVS